MIFDGYWKKELIQNAKKLCFWCKCSKIYPSYAEHQINKMVLYSAVVMRKFFEDEKHAETTIKKVDMPMPTMKLLEYKVKVLVYPFSGDEEFIIENVIPGNYDCKNAVIEEIELNKLCNQIIHSYVWSVSYSKQSKKLNGMLFASDKAKTKELYLLELNEFIKAINFCVENGNI